MYAKKKGGRREGVSSLGASAGIGRRICISALGTETHPLLVRSLKAETVTRRPRRRSLQNEVEPRRLQVIFFTELISYFWNNSSESKL